MSDLLHRPLTEIVDLLARRELSPVELMGTTLDRIDATREKLNAFVLLIVKGICALVVIAGPRSLGHDVPEDRHYLFYAAYLLCMTGLAGMTVTGDVFRSEPNTLKPRFSSISAMPFIPDPPMPIMWMFLTFFVNGPLSISISVSFDERLCYHTRGIGFTERRQTGFHVRAFLR